MASHMYNQNSSIARVGQLKNHFLPVKCDACSNIFCHEHMKYADHDCPEGKSRDVQVPVCPLCNSPVPSKRGEPPDIAVGAHIDRDCQSDPAVGRRKVFTNRCFVKGCKKKELIPFLCSSCQNNFCVSHRHPSDHNCQLKLANKRLNGSTARNSIVSRNGGYEAIQGNMSEDEALAHALALSMNESQQTQIRYNNVIPGIRSSRNHDSNCVLS